MNSLLERCAFAFARDLPADMPILTDALRALVERLAPTAPAWLPDLDDELRAAPRETLLAVDAAFREQFREDAHECVDVAVRLGAADHFPFENALRMRALIEAIALADVDLARKLWQPGAGTASPVFRPGGATERGTVWPILEKLAEALVEGSHDALAEAQRMRRGVRVTNRRHTVQLRPCFKTLARRLGRRSSQTGDAAPTKPATTLHSFGAVPCGVAIGGLLPPDAFHDTFRVAADDCHAGHAFIVDRMSGAVSMEATSAEGAPLLFFVAAYAAAGRLLPVIVQQRRGALLVATHRLTVDARPLDALRGAWPSVASADEGRSAWSAHAQAVAPDARTGHGGPPVRPAADPNSPSTRAARLATDPLLRRALETLFRHRALSEHDLSAIGGGLLIVDWAAFVDRAATDGLLHVQMNFGPDGKVYRLLE